MTDINIEQSSKDLQEAYENSIALYGDEAMGEPSERWCYSIGGKYGCICTRPQGHEGKHIAHGNRGNKVDEWKNEAEKNTDINPEREGNRRDSEDADTPSAG